jgi:hypothetical protein
VYYYVGVDIGGTFTDCVLVDRQGNHRTAKVLSTKDDPVAGVLAGLSLLAETAGVDLPTLLERTERLGHGTTIGTNAVLERRGARVGLVATAGHGDALAMMRGAGRVASRSIEGVFSVHGSRLPAPLIVPGAVVEVQERIDASGKVVVELDADAAVERITGMIVEYELDSIAVALLWSFANPAHEKALAQAIHQVIPDAFVSCSSEVSPRLGEYERTVATVLNGYVGPACSRYLSELESRLATPLLVMQAGGGVLPASTAIPLGTIDSGPAGGLIGVATLAGAYGHDNMIGSLAASPAGDGVAYGGHFWIPEGTASNIEELELLWPMLFLYRRALKAGADGAGRFRGGRGFVEAGIPWTVPGMAAAVYVDESFPKAVGPFGGNPGSAGHFRLKHGTDVIASLVAGQVPQDFDSIDGAETEVEAKGPMLMMGADAVWEWTGANAPGFGDPVLRDPAQVELDIATGALPADTAERVYGVVPGDGATQTLRLRAERLAARLADAVPPGGTPATVPANVPLRVLAGELAVLERDGRPEAFVTRHRPCSACLGQRQLQGRLRRAGRPAAYGRPGVRHPERPGRLPDAIPRVPVPGHRPAGGL